MGQIDRSTDNTEPSPFMTDYAYDDDATHFSVSDPVWRILTGAAAFAIGVFICGSVGSYVATDPSWNAATDSDVQNLFGRSGAVFADLARQTLGWSAWTALVLYAVQRSRRPWQSAWKQRGRILIRSYV